MYNDSTFVASTTIYTPWQTKASDTSQQEVDKRLSPSKRYVYLLRLQQGANSQAVLTGLAPNGGLYIPTEIPTLPSDWQTKWANLSFPELSHEILSLFIPTADIPSEDLKTIINKSYSSFRDPVTTPIRKTGEKEYVLELWHGPTWAFKDVALQFLGETFAYFLGRRNEGKTEGKEELTVVGATSGDTGR